MPAWLDNAVFYQIYPQSFYDTNGDGIGDLEGIIQKLDYIGWLGCDAVWLNPCFASPFYDAGYDVSDYRQVAPRYGNNEDMRRLIAEAHRRGIRVLLDMVPGHTSLEHEWFQKSARGEAGLAGRYIWAGGWDNFEGIEGVRGGISGYFQRGCCAVNFFSCQPALNYGFAAPDPDKPWQIPPGAPDALATRDALTDAMRFWLSMGCDGFRVDMAGSLVKGDGGPAATAALWQDVLGRLRGEFPEAVWVSEWSNPALSAVAGFDMDFLLPFGTLPYMRLFREQPYFARRGSGGSGGMDAFVAGYERLLKTVASHGPHGSQGSHGPHGSMICIPSGNHDTPRISRRLDDNELRLSFAFLLSIPGAP
ncbi:MAG: alpha-amylase family glycosyl hydrolase, partial [Oscillospiraceae bacterium]|nr:alpha-amylase family glycosyl hydrolase [Oscillospiraceae bacterium]